MSCKQPGEGPRIEMTGYTSWKCPGAEHGKDNDDDDDDCVKNSTVQC